jgi:hypothetical protein
VLLGTTSTKKGQKTQFDIILHHFFSLPGQNCQEQHVQPRGENLTDLQFQYITQALKCTMSSKAGLLIDESAQHVTEMDAPDERERERERDKKSP